MRTTVETPGPEADVLSRHIGAVARLTLNKPRNRNALSTSMIASLEGALRAASATRGCKVIVLAAEGTVFSAGHDLKEMTAARAAEDKGEAFFTKLFADCAALMLLLNALPQPIIAEVRGPATAAGCQLVAACDLAIASNEARFATPGVNIGLFCATPMVALSRAVPRKQALEMLLTGEWIDATRAAEIGLINRTAATERLEYEVMALANHIAEKPKLTVGTGKASFYAQTGLGEPLAYAQTARTMAESMLKGEAKEGIEAFLEKRSPLWEDI